VATHPVKRAYFGMQWRRMVRFERAACRRFDVVVAVSEQDAAHFRDVYGVAHPVAVPTGVDTEYFPGPRGWPREERHLVFTGSMDWMPNEDGIRFFAEQVMPRLRNWCRGETHGGGAGADGGAPGAGGAAPRHPPDREGARRAAVAGAGLGVGGAAPGGGGTRLKIYEAMAMECPVVSTTIGAEGLPLRDGEHILLADDAESLAAACARVLVDDSQGHALALAAARYVREEFGWDAAARVFSGACEMTIEDAAGRPISHCEAIP